MISELYVQIDRNNGKNAHVFEKNCWNNWYIYTIIYLYGVLEG